MSDLTTHRSRTVREASLEECPVALEVKESNNGLFKAVVRSFSGDSSGSGRSKFCDFVHLFGLFLHFLDMRMARLILGLCSHRRASES